MMTAYRDIYMLGMNTDLYNLSYRFSIGYEPLRGVKTGTNLYTFARFDSSTFNLLESLKIIP